MIKTSRSSRIEHIMLLTFSRSVFFTFFWNESKSIKHNNLFATRHRSAEIIKKKKIWRSFKRRDNERISRIFWLIWWRIRRIVVLLSHKSIMRQDKVNHKTWTISLFMLKFSRLISTNSFRFNKRIIFSID